MQVDISVTRRMNEAAELAAHGEYEAAAEIWRSVAFGPTRAPYFEEQTAMKNLRTAERRGWVRPAEEALRLA